VRPDAGERLQQAAPQATPPSRKGSREQEAARRALLERLGPEALLTRVDEEISRSSRHGTSLCCLLVQISNLSELASMHGEAFAEHALQHVGEVLLGELRRFDRVGQPLENELVVVLPGAGRAQGEAVARRSLSRLQAIKVEIDRVRRPLAVSVGIAAWSEPWTAERLIEEARAAAAVADCDTED
jgi:diguanylate cyclase (GGDEF)-like protein